MRTALIVILVPVVIWLGLTIGLQVPWVAKAFVLAAALLLLVLAVQLVQRVIRAVWSRRWQFTLRTALIVTALCAVACALWKCEDVAQKGFEERVAIVGSILQKLQPQLDKGVDERWLQRARSNATFSAWEKQRPPIVTNRSTGEGTALGYFGTSHSWSYERATLRTDFDATNLYLHGPQETRVNIEITCSRCWSLISRVTTVRIDDRGPPDNALLLDPLKAELDRNKIPYSVDARRR